MKSMTLTLSNDILLNGERAQVHDWIRDALDDDYGVFAIDLSGVTVLDEAAIGELVACFAVAEERGAQIAITNLGDGLKRRLQSLLFSTIFKVFNSNEEALRFMRAHAPRRQPSNDRAARVWSAQGERRV